MAALAGGAEIPPDFELAGEGGTAPFVIDADLDVAVVRAADDVRRDIERASGQLPKKITGRNEPVETAVLVGIVGQAKWLQALSDAGKIDLKPLTNSWETFVIAVIDQPQPGIPRGLVIAGSDRRGAIFGLYEISNLIGVSPWNWWADVPVVRKPTLSIPSDRRVVGPPSVKYRGLFINDEDWGLQPWAARTYEPEAGSIGPKTYARIFELVLRLRGNLVWPAMHPSTRAFSYYPENKKIADAYGVVMGSSHAEPMLRNNVDEWKAPQHEYDFVHNREGVLKYWERRVVDNGKYENVYTLGMRGIHDSLMIGPRDDAERVRTLEEIFAAQRDLLAKYVKPEVNKIPQMFCAYKELLELYQLGLKVPDDAIFVWPDDNFGYVRGFNTEDQRRRQGGSGVYYHLSYLGRPLSYLWLSTTPPALIWQQLHQSYEYGADRLWVANVGDIKPGEISTEFFFQLAWDINRWTAQSLPLFLEQWARREFGQEHGPAIASIMADYYLLNFQRRPEHLQWWLPGKSRQFSPLTDEEITQRLQAFENLRNRSEAIRAAMPPDAQDAYYQLVHYPVVGSALANERYFRSEQGDNAAAQSAHAELVAATRYFNEKVSGGKWKGIMALEPADGLWNDMRVAPWKPFDAPRVPQPSPLADSYIELAADAFSGNESASMGKWTVIPGLGRTGRAVTVLPSTSPSFEISAAKGAPRLDYEVQVPTAGEHVLEAQLLPTHPINSGGLRFAVAVDDAEPQAVVLTVTDNGDWAQGVLNGVRRASVSLRFRSPGRHVIHIYGTEPGVVIDKLILDFGTSRSTYLGPDKEGRSSTHEAAEPR